MNTNDLIKKCIEIPGVSLKKNPNNTELCMEQANGKGSMTFFSIFPGISLAYIFINSPINGLYQIYHKKKTLPVPLCY